MRTTTLTAYRSGSVSIRLTDIRHSGYALVSTNHFALPLGRSIDISAALSQKLNPIQLFVSNKGFIIGGRWEGRFEISVNGKLIGAYAENGFDIRRNQVHLVAEIEFQITEQPRNTRDPDISRIAHQLQRTLGMTTADKTDFAKADPFITFQNGATICLLKNFVGVDHVFVIDQSGTCVFGGYVGWVHAKGLRRVLNDIRHKYSQYIV